MSAPAAESQSFTHREILTVFSGILLAMLLAALDQTIVATALPTITGELGGLDHLSWVVTAYLLTATASTPIYGKLSDLYGRQRLVQAAIAIFLLGSVLSGLAQSMVQLVAFRALQGLGGGGLMALAFAVIGDVVAPRERGRYQGYISGVFAIASVGGPLLGGVITEVASWRWVFFINLPLGLVALAMTQRALGRLGRRPGPVAIDFAGAGLMAAAVTCLLLVLTWGGTELPWTSTLILGLLAAGLVLFVGFLIQERRAPEPILPLRLFGVSVFTVACLTTGLAAMIMLGGVTFLPLYLQLVVGVSISGSGFLLLPLMAGILASSVAAGRVVSRTGRYKALPVGGLLLAGIVFVLLAVSERMARQATIPLLVLLGLGLGLVMPVVTVAVQNAVERRDLGAATASISFFRSLGGVLGVALFGSILSNHLDAALRRGGVAGGPPLDARVLDGGPSAILALPSPARETVIGGFGSAFEILFLVAAGVAFAAFLVALRLRELPLRSAADRPPPD